MLCTVFKSKTFHSKHLKKFLQIRRRLFHRKVLGIETSCDDTGAAVVDESGTILGEALNSQTAIHLQLGGINPPNARDLHDKHIKEVVQHSLDRANCTVNDVDAIAVTVKPGLALSLLVGMKYAKELCKNFKKPIIPIHHMEAHALTIRMLEKIEFPFLVLLISGGHCILSVVRSVDDFLTLGNCHDNAPGEAFDKVARRLKLKDIPEFSNVSGGQAIERLALTGNPKAFTYPIPLSRHRDCNFSFSGLQNTARNFIIELEKKHEVEPDGYIPNLPDFCASFQYAVTVHFIKRLHRGIIFCERKELLPEVNRNLVVSGGVACNAYINNALRWFCNKFSYNLYCTPPKLCTDNGIMIAWNGVERLRAGVGVTKNLDQVDIEAKCALGHDLSIELQNCNIPLPRLKLEF